VAKTIWSRLGRWVCRNEQGSFCYLVGLRKGNRGFRFREGEKCNGWLTVHEVATSQPQPPLRVAHNGAPPPLEVANCVDSLWVAVIF
jgi:hypothetical protein